MTPTEHLTHTAPLIYLIREKLHKDVSFKQRCINMRARRWRDKLANKPNMMPDEEEPTNEAQD